MMAERPLSPFLTVHRWAYTMTLSILHRATGVALIAALLGLVIWLISASFGADCYAAVLPALTSVAGKVVMCLAVIALIYHFCNGLRHLAWDIGWGFERSAARRSGKLVLLATLIGSALCIYWILAHPAGAA
jgi:succinate dehydrogenase / fumarate reductase cytochrome b subunit